MWVLAKDFVLIAKYIPGGEIADYSISIKRTCLQSCACKSAKKLAAVEMAPDGIKVSFSTPAKSLIEV